jgi:hypothetical protein
MDVTCAGCGATVFTIAGWSDLDHCPACGRRLAVGEPVGGRFVPRVERRLAGEDPIAAMSLRLDECLEEAHEAINELFHWPVMRAPEDDPRRSH